MTALSGPGTRIEIGDLGAYLDADGSFLRAIALSGEEVFRGIGFVVRDCNWGTYALQAVPQIVRTSEQIAIHVAGHVTGADGDLDWTLTWTLRPDGIAASMHCASAAGFPTNRTGFVVLHSLPASRGQPITVSHSDGQTEEARFPDLVSPHQPFMDLAAMAYRTAAGHQLWLHFAGEVFETEDQRNWTDASYKTYSRPLSKPFPYRITTDAPERQSLHLEILHRGIHSAGGGQGPVVLRETILPPLGVSIAPGTASLGLNDAIGRLAPAFVAVEIDLSRDNAVAETASLFSMLPGPLRLDIRPAESAAVISALERWQPQLRGRRLIGLSLWGADDALIAAARRLLPHTPIGSGTGAFFTELNRGTAWPTSADYLTWTSNPTVHGWTDDTIGESIEPLEDIRRTARAKWPHQGFHVGPLTFGMRFNPNATTAEGRARGAAPDPRQTQPIAAAWLVGMVAGYADEKVESLTFFEALGSRGLITDDGRLTPAAAVFTRLAGYAGASLGILSWPGQPRLRGLRLGEGPSMVFCLANLHHEAREVRLPDGRSVTVGGFDTVWVDGTG